MTASLAETIRIADSYALGDPTQPLLMSVDGMTETQIYDAAGSQRRQERSEYRSKRRDERPNYRYGSTQVAAVSQDHPDAGSSQRQRTNGQQQWVPKNDGKRPYDQRKQYQDRQKYTYEMMLDQPCKFHTPSPSKLANHTTRQCTWFQKGDRVDSPNKQLPRHHLQEEMLKQWEQITDTKTGSRGIISRKKRNCSPGAQSKR